MFAHEEDTRAFSEWCTRATTGRGRAWCEETHPSWRYAPLDTDMRLDEGSEDGYTEAVPEAPAADSSEAIASAQSSTSAQSRKSP